MDKKTEELIDKLASTMVDKIIEKSSTEKSEEKPEEKVEKKSEEKLETKLEKSKVEDNTEVTAVLSEMKALVSELKKARQEEAEAKEKARVETAKVQQKKDMQEMAKSMLVEMAKELGITAPAGERKGVVKSGTDNANDKTVEKKNIDGMTVKQFKALPIEEQDQHVYDYFRKAMGIDDIAELKKDLASLESEE